MLLDGSQVHARYLPILEQTLITYWADKKQFDLSLDHKKLSLHIIKD